MLPKDNSEEYFKEYKKTIIDYVETGNISDVFKKKELLNTISTLSKTQKESLGSIIDFEITNYNAEYLGKSLGTVPKSATWSTLAGVVVGVVQSRVFDNDSAAPAGFFAGGITFFAQEIYTNHQRKRILSERINRAKEFLLHLSEKNVNDMQIDIGETNLKLGKT